MMFHSILLVENHAFLRECVSRALERHCHVHVIEAASGEVAWATLVRLRPALLISDVALSGPLDGLALAARTTAELPATSVLIYSADPSYATAASQAGARVFLWKGSPTFLDDLRDAVLHTASAGG